jgi:hypothetical protein
MVVVVEDSTTIPKPQGRLPQEVQNTLVLEAVAESHLVGPLEYIQHQHLANG